MRCTGCEFDTRRDASSARHAAWCSRRPAPMRSRQRGRGSVLRRLWPAPCHQALRRLLKGAATRPGETVARSRFFSVIWLATRASRPSWIRKTFMRCWNAFHAGRRDRRPFGGTLDQHIGDAAMALFGAPVAHGNDAERAVRAAMQIRAPLSELNSSPPLSAHIGVATGEVVASSVGSQRHRRYTVTGEAANLAARPSCARCRRRNACLRRCLPGDQPRGCL